MHSTLYNRRKATHTAHLEPALALWSFWRPYRFGCSLSFPPPAESETKETEAGFSKGSLKILDGGASIGSLQGQPPGSCLTTRPGLQPDRRIAWKQVRVHVLCVERSLLCKSEQQWELRDRRHPFL